MNLEKEIFDIALTDIIPNRFQPREMFDDGALQELSQSIKEHGVIQPIIVRKVGDKYEIIAGERRYRASQLAGKQTIPALVRDIDDKEAAKIALLENLQRSNLTPIEEAKTYQTILKLDNITQEELAQNLGKSQSTIANKLRLLTLDEEVQTALLNSQISERHARSLLGLDIQRQNELLHRIINEKMTVRQVDEEVMRLTGKIPEGVNAVNQEVPNPQEGGNSMNQTITPSFTQNQAGVPITQPSVASNIGTPVINQGINTVPEINKTNEPVSQATAQQPVIATPQVEVPNPAPQVEVPTVDTEPINQETVQPEAPSLEPAPFIKDPAIEQILKAGKEAAEVPNPEEPAPVVEETPVVANQTPQAEAKPENIFDKLRVKPEEPTKQEEKPVIPAVNNLVNTQAIINSEEEKQPEPFNNIYDLRFAINNFRQAIQNTEKFGFKVTANEYDSENKYQIVIEIEKKN